MQLGVIERLDVGDLKRAVKEALVLGATVAVRLQVLERLFHQPHATITLTLVVGARVAHAARVLCHESLVQRQRLVAPRLHDVGVAFAFHGAFARLAAHAVHVGARCTRRCIVLGRWHAWYRGRRHGHALSRCIVSVAVVFTFLARRVANAVIVGGRLVFKVDA